MELLVIPKLISNDSLRLIWFKTVKQESPAKGFESVKEVSFKGKPTDQTQVPFKRNSQALRDISTQDADSSQEIRGKPRGYPSRFPIKRIEEFSSLRHAGLVIFRQGKVNSGGILKATRH